MNITRPNLPAIERFYANGKRYAAVCFETMARQQQRKMMNYFAFDVANIKVILEEHPCITPDQAERAMVHVNAAAYLIRQTPSADVLYAIVAHIKDAYAITSEADAVAEDQGLILPVMPDPRSLPIGKRAR